MLNRNRCLYMSATSLIWRLRIDDADVLLLLNEPLAHNH